MPLKQLKRLVKSSPFLYRRLYPLVQRARLAKEERLINRFRDYCRTLSDRVAEPIFVKVGANDGVTDDPCSDIFLANPKWRGLLIEPVPYCFASLQKNFPDRRRFILEQIAIGSPSGEAIFYYVDGNARNEMSDWQSWFDKLGSFDRQHILKHLNGKLAPYIIECRVPVRPLTKILIQSRLPHVHILHVDTEGHDYEVLKTLDFSRFAPLAILVEHCHLSADKKAALRELLERHGYAVQTSFSEYFAVNTKADRRLR